MLNPTRALTFVLCSGLIASAGGCRPKDPAESFGVETPAADDTPDPTESDVERSETSGTLSTDETDDTGRPSTRDDESESSAVDDDESTPAEDDSTPARDGGESNGGDPVTDPTSPGPARDDAGSDQTESSVELDAGGGMTPEAGVEQPPEVSDDCGEPPTSSASFTRPALREAAAECAIWHYCKYHAIAQHLDEKVQQYADAPDEGTLASAQQAWSMAMSWWSRLELFQFGPLASKSESAGKDMYEGQGIRDLVYAWPSTSRCRIEEQLISQNYASRGMDGVLISGRGLFGLEYLLYYSGSDTECAAATSTAKSWASLSKNQIAQRKQDYAVALTSDQVTQSERLVEAWAASGGNFKQTFVEAGGMYPDEQEAMKVLAWALVYAEREIKDWKLGIPAGYTLNHPVSNPETPYALVATENIRANLEGFRSLFEGCGADGAGLGFDDWLIEVGHPELASEMLAALADARSAAAEFPPLHTASAEEIEALYQAIRRLTTLLKSDFFGAGSPLNLELPGGVQSDTD